MMAATLFTILGVADGEDDEVAVDVCGLGGMIVGYTSDCSSRFGSGLCSGCLGSRIHNFNVPLQTCDRQ